MATEAAQKCKHGTRVEWCYLCSPPPKPIGVRRKAGPAPVYDIADYPPPEYERVVPSSVAYFCTSAPLHLREKAARGLTSKIEDVYIGGHPFVWAFRLILQRCPNVQRIFLNPSGMKALRAGSIIHPECQARRVRILEGSLNPTMTGEVGTPLHDAYRKNRKMLQNLSGQLLADWNDLRAFEVEHAVITARYYCMNEGDEYLSMIDLAPLFGKTGVMGISNSTLRVVAFLTGEGNQDSLTRARGLRRKLARMRAVRDDAATRQHLLTRLALPALPAGLPLGLLDEFEFVLMAHRAGKLTRFPERTRAMLNQRYGLEAPFTYSILQEVGDRHGRTRERVRMILNDALASLGWSAVEE